MKTPSPYQQATDTELLNMYRTRGDRKALGDLLQRYTLLLLGVCLKYLKDEEEAKDAVQQVFSKVIGEVDKYEITHFKSWLYTITRNHCFMQLRHKIRPVEEDVLERNGHWLQQETYETILQHQQEKDTLLTMIEEALQLLQPNQRECISLFYLEKKSYRQISDRTGFTEQQVKSYIQNGKRNMRLMIEKKQKHYGS